MGLRGKDKQVGLSRCSAGKKKKNEFLEFSDTRVYSVKIVVAYCLSCYKNAKAEHVTVFTWIEKFNLWNKSIIPTDQKAVTGVPHREKTQLYPSNCCSSI